MTRLPLRLSGTSVVARRAGVLAVALAATTTLAACGGDSNDDGPATSTQAQTRLIDSKKVSDSIVASIREQRSIKATASCPGGIVQEEGATFECTARYRVKGMKDRVKATFVVTQRAGGNVTYVAK